MLLSEYILTQSEFGAFVTGLAAARIPRYGSERRTAERNATGSSAAEAEPAVKEARLAYLRYLR